MEIRNDSEYEFSDISSESVRTYDFGDFEVTIQDPQYLAVSDNGHRVLDGSGVSHYVQFGWKHLYWNVDEGEPHFVK